MSMVSPETFGRYRVAGTLGQGAMGAVYRAHDPLIDRMVAIKVIHAELLDGEAREDFRARFRLEAQAAGRCAHPNIVAVYDFSDEGDSPYIVMELVEGESLQAALRRRGPLPAEEAAKAALQILSALEYAHSAGITHRDIKPANILLLPEGRLKVMDFGIARLNRASLTQTGVMVGTPSYMAPEQILGTKVDHRADLFATGIVLYEMLVGRTPFAGSDSAQLLYNIAHKDLSLGEELNAVPASLDRILRRALTRDPECRYPSATEFASALQATVAAPARAAPASDATVFAPPRRTGSNPSASGSGPGSGSIDPALMTQAERELASHVGPMARIFVKKAAQSATSVEEFYRSLAANIPRERERTQFLSRGGRSEPTGIGAPPTGAAPAPPPSSDPAPATGPAPLPPGSVEVAQGALAVFVGPIAKVLARKAAEQARDLDDFHDRLAAHLDREDDRTAFRRRVRAGGAPKTGR